MYRRQFVSPFLKRPFPTEEETRSSETEDKKPRLAVRPVSAVDVARTPLLNLQVPNYCPQGRPSEGSRNAYFNVLWRNQTTKKNKTWDGDGVLVLEDGFLTLRDVDGKKLAQLARVDVNCRIGSKAWMTGTLSVGDALKIGNKDVEVRLC